jgi:hypothetical protein
MKKEQKLKRAYLAPDVILRMILKKDDDTLNRLIPRQGTDIVFMTSAFCYWEVFCCLTAKEIKKYADRIEDILMEIPIVDTESVSGQLGAPNKDRINHLRGIAIK